MGKPNEKAGAKPVRKPSAKRAPLTPGGYVATVLRMRDAAPGREKRLLQRVPQEFQVEAAEMLGRLDRK